MVCVRVVSAVSSSLHRPVSCHFSAALKMGSTDPYGTLGVAKTASPREVKLAYHRLSLLLHPDKVSIPEAKEGVYFGESVCVCVCVCVCV